MLSKEDWEASIGRVYRTRSGDLMRIAGMSDSPIDWEIFQADHIDGSPGAHYDIDGNVERHHEWDLMEMVRTSNVPRASGQSCG